MNELDIEIIRVSVQVVISKGALALKSFSSRLYEMDSTVRKKMRKINFENPEAMIENLNVLVDNIDNIEGMKDTLAAWGKALKDMGIEKSDYQTIGSVYTDTLAFVFGSAFTPEVMNAWVKVFKTAMPYMLEGAE